MYWLGTAADKTDQMGLSYSTISFTGPKQPHALFFHASWEVRLSRGRARPPANPHTRGILLVYNGADDNLSIAPASPSSTGAIPKLLSRSDTPSSPPKKMREKVARYPTLSSLKGWWQNR